MTAQERSAWVFGVVAVAGYATYLALLAIAARSTPLTETAYAPLVVGTIVGAIVAGIVLNIIVSIIAGIGGGRSAARVDDRDREISRLGERVGNAPLVLGALVALVLALVEADAFWIANVLYLGFVLSAVLGTAARLTTYRGGMLP